MGAVDTVNWLRECLREDRARRGVRDFFSARVENRKFLKGAELLASDDLPSDVVGAAYGQKLSDRLASHGRRREVVYGTLFLVGRRMGRAWCAPVLLYPGRVSRAGVGELVLAHWTLNPVLRDELDLAEELEVELDRLLPLGLAEWQTRKVDVLREVLRYL